MVGAADARVLAVLTRAPSSGGKSRLFGELRLPPDRHLLESLLLDTIDAAAPADALVVVAVTAPSGCAEVAALVSPLRAPGSKSIDVIEQPEGDLGARMHGTMAELFARGARMVALIGSDLPEVDGAVVDAAFDALARDPGTLVLGPANDGGYYLVAATYAPPVFEGIEWGSPSVLQQTQRAAAARGLRVHLLPPRGDVDTVADLTRVASSGAAPRTGEWLRSRMP